MIFYCGLMAHITDTRAQKVFCCTSAHITETVLVHDQHWEEQSSNQCCHSVMKKNPRIYLEKTPENDKRNPDKQNV